MKGDRVLSRAKCCRTGIELFSFVFSIVVLCRFREADSAPRNARVLRAESSSRVSLHVCRRQSLSLTGSSVVTPLLYTFTYIDIYTRLVWLFNLLLFLCVCMCAKHDRCFPFSSCSVIPWPKTPVVPPRSPRTSITTRQRVL